MQLNVRRKKMERQSKRYRREAVTAFALYRSGVCGRSLSGFLCEGERKKTPRRGDGRVISLILKLMRHLVWEVRGTSSQVKPRTQLGETFEGVGASWVSAVIQPACLCFASVGLWVMGALIIWALVG